MILLRESNVYFLLLTDLCADQLILKSRDEAAGTDRQGVILCLAALECLAVYKAFEIKLDDITLLYCSVIHVDHSGVVLAFFIYFFLYFLFGNFDYRFLHFNALVIAKCYSRLQSYFCCEDERLAFLDLCHTDLRLGNDLLSALFCSRCICFRNYDICSILIKDACAVHFLDHLSRCFSFTEARNVDFLLIFLISFLQCSSKLFC